MFVLFMNRENAIDCFVKILKIKMQVMGLQNDVEDFYLKKAINLVADGHVPDIKRTNNAPDVEAVYQIAIQLKQEMVEILSLVKNAAKARGDVPVGDQFIQKALEEVDAGNVEVKKYSNGKPSLKALYDLAVELSSGANR